jgi:hypothetical protein
VLDGEVAVFDKQNRPRFEWLHQRRPPPAPSTCCTLIAAM